MRIWTAAVVLLALALTGCTDPEGARRVLEVDGFTEIEMTGYKGWLCSDKDTFATGFRATKNGRTISGAVCSGGFKGYTIRFQ